MKKFSRKTKIRIFAALIAIVFAFFGVRAEAFLFWNKSDFVQVYPSEVKGSWKDASKAKGIADVESDEGADRFDATNSAVYEGGAEELVLSGFSRTFDDLNSKTEDEEILEQLQGESKEGEDESEEDEKDGEESSQEEAIEEDELEETETDGTENENVVVPEERENEAEVEERDVEEAQEDAAEDEEEPEELEEEEGSEETGFLENLRTFFGGNSVSAKQKMGFKDVKTKKILGAKLKTSFAILDDEQTEGSQQTEEFEEKEEPDQEESSSWLKKGFQDMLAKIQERSLFVSKAKASAELFEMDIDAKIVIWYSLDGDSPAGEWEKLDTITQTSASNKDNQGYFSYDLAFLQSWKNVENLQLKFEGIVGGETTFTVFLDSVWLEIEFQDDGVDAPVMSTEKRNWLKHEHPKFRIEDADQQNKGFIKKTFDNFSALFESEPEKFDIQVKLIDPVGNELELEKDKNFKVRGKTQVEVEIDSLENSLPGEYQIQITLEDEGAVFEFEESFIWGVLAVNFNKSVYLENEEAYVQMAALDEEGHTVCNAHLEVEITDPEGEVEEFSVGNETITNSDTCGADNVTDVPDYFFNYQTGKKGDYQVKLTNLDNGNEMSDSFQVVGDIDFDVERIGATRINPFKSKYRMNFKIKANRDFRGQIRENVPEGFEIVSEDGLEIIEGKEGDQIKWGDVELKEGDDLEISYEYQAPKVSPQLFLLGPLQIISSEEEGFLESLFLRQGMDEDIVFEEVRQWQIASDAVTTYSAGSGTWTALVTGTITVECWGAGGAGGGGQNANGLGGGGGAGGQFASSSISVTKETGYAYSVGTGGTGVARDTNGNPGGDTTFGSSTVVAKGGAGGTRYAGGGGGGIGTTTGGVGNIAVYAGGSGATQGSGYGGGGGGGAGSGGTGNNASTSTGGLARAEEGGAGGAGGVGNSDSGSGGSNYGGAGGGATRNGTSGAGAGGLIRITYPDNTAPTVAQNTLDATDFGSDTTPTLEFTGTDANYLDDIRYNIQICTTSNCSSVLLDKDSGTPAHTGFAGSPDNTDPFTSGQLVSYTVQAGEELTSGTYYWQVRGIDPSGTNTYGSWSGIRSFTVTVVGITVDGIIYSDEGTTPYQCSSTGNLTVDVRVGGAGSYTAECTQDTGAFSVTAVTINNPGDVVTIFINENGAGSVYSTTVTKANNTTSDITVNLYQNHVIIRHEDAGPVTIDNLDNFDSGNDSDVQFTATNGTPDTLMVNDGHELYIWSGDTFTPGGDVTVDDIKILGTYTATGSESITVSGSWVNSGTFTSASSTVTFDATSGTESINSTGATLDDFNNVVLGSGSGTATWNLGSVLDVNGNLTIDYGTLGQGTNNITLNGNLAIGAGGNFTSGSGTLTFDGASTPVAWSNTATIDDLGAVVIDGTAKTVNLASSVQATSITVGADDVLGLESSGYVLTLSGSGTAGSRPLIINNALGLTEGTNSTVKYAGTSATEIEDETYYNLELAPAGAGSPTFTLGTAGSQTVAVSGNLIIGDGTYGVTVNADIYDPTLDVEGDLTISANGALTASATVTFTVGGSWSNLGTFTHSSGLVEFDSTNTGETISDGGSAFHGLLFDGIGGGWLYADGTSTAPNSTTVQNGEATFFNTKTGTLSATGGIFNQDWYLGTHVVDAAQTTTNIDTGDNDITISEAGSNATVWKHNGADWGTAAASQTTGTAVSGINPQPNNSGAIRIREFSMTSSASCPGAGCTLYRYNEQITWVGSYGEYDYHDDQGENYLTSCYANTSACSDDTTDDDVIGTLWYRATPGTINTPYGTVNEPPTQGSWYVGMLEAISFTIDSFSRDFGALTPGGNPTDVTNTITVTTSATHGYVVYARAEQDMTCSNLDLCGTAAISDWPSGNDSPTAWNGGSYGFGYSTNDYDLQGGTANRFSGPTFAGFTELGFGDPVADRTGPSSSQQNIVTYRIAADSAQTAGTYQTGIIYVIAPVY